MYYIEKPVLAQVILLLVKGFNPKRKKFVKKIKITITIDVVVVVAQLNYNNDKNIDSSL